MNEKIGGVIFFGLPIFNSLLVLVDVDKNSVEIPMQFLIVEDGHGG